MRRSLDLYSEKQASDAGPDKIAASKAFCHEANSISFAFGQPPREDTFSNSAYLAFRDDALRLSKDAPSVILGKKALMEANESAKDGSGLLSASRLVKESSKADEVSPENQTSAKDAAPSHKEQAAKKNIGKDQEFDSHNEQFVGALRAEGLRTVAPNERKGLLSLFDPEPQNLQLSKRDRDKLCALAKTNPLLLIKMGQKMLIPPEIRRLANQIIYDDSVVCERFHRLAARQAFILNEGQAHESTKFQEKHHPFTDKSVTISASKSDVRNEKVKPTGDRLSIVHGTRRPEGARTWASKDIEKTKKLRKQKQMLVDYLEKFRGTLSLREVSDVISQIERLDKALLSTH